MLARPVERESWPVSKREPLKTHSRFAQEFEVGGIVLETVLQVLERKLEPLGPAKGKKP